MGWFQSTESSYKSLQVIENDIVSMPLQLYCHPEMQLDCC